MVAARSHRVLDPVVLEEIHPHVGAELLRLPARVLDLLGRLLDGVEELLAESFLRSVFGIGLLEKVVELTTGVLVDGQGPPAPSSSSRPCASSGCTAGRSGEHGGQAQYGDHHEDEQGNGDDDASTLPADHVVLDPLRSALILGDASTRRNAHDLERRVDEAQRPTTSSAASTRRNAHDLERRVDETQRPRPRAPRRRDATPTTSSAASTRRNAHDLERRANRDATPT